MQVIVYQTMENKSVRKEFDNYQTVYPHIWNQYSIYFQRYNAYTNRLNTLGTISSILILIYFSLPFKHNTNWIYLTLLFFLFPFFITIANYFISKKIAIPWVERDELESQLSEGINTFFKRQIDDLYYCADTMFGYAKSAKKWIKYSLVSMLIGILYYIIISLYFYCLDL